MVFSSHQRHLRPYFSIIIIITLIFILIYTWNGFINNKFDSPILIELQSEPEENVQIKTRKLFNIELKYILSPNSCSPNATFGVIIVTSHCNNVETRSAMRRTFSQNDLLNLGLQRYFLLGEAPDNAYMTKASLLHESKRFGDILQGNFAEAYRNLTYKHVMGLKWVSENCPNVKYVMKMDDDIVINLPRMINQLCLPNNSIGGYVLRNMKPIREPANKWFVRQEEYRFDSYPSFVSGWFYVTTPKIASKLVLLSHYFKYFWIDDVFVTGILAKNLRIKLINMKEYFTVFPEFLQCCIRGAKEKRLNCDIVVGPNGGDNNLFYKFNKAMEICHLEKCHERIRPLNETCVGLREVHLMGGSGSVENYNLH